MPPFPEAGQADDAQPRLPPPAGAGFVAVTVDVSGRTTVQLSADPSSLSRGEVSTVAPDAAGPRGTPGGNPRPERPRPARGGLRRAGLGLAGVVGVIALLELVVRTGLLPQAWFPPPSEIFPAFVRLVADGECSAAGADAEGWSSASSPPRSSPSRWVWRSGRWSLAHRLTRFLLEFLRPIPPVALHPGRRPHLRQQPRHEGVPDRVRHLLADPAADRLRHPRHRPHAAGHRPVVRAARRARLVRIVLPSALPYLATGLRIASAIGLILAVTARTWSGTPGIGGRISDAQSAGDAQDVMYAWILAAGLLGWLLNRALQAVERRLPALAPVVPAGGPVIRSRLGGWALALVAPVLLLVGLRVWAAAAGDFFFPPLSEIGETFAEDWLFTRVPTDLLPSLAACSPAS